MNIAVAASTSKTQFFVNQAYVDYVEEAGYEPVLVTPKNNMAAVVDFCDGLLLPGGIDLDPMYYGEDNDYSLEVDPEKDKFERALFYTFAQAGRPIFGICRGFQLIVREFLQNSDNPVLENHFDYYQNVNGHNQGSLSAKRHIATHMVDILPQALYGDIIPPRVMYQGEDSTTIGVNSMHHQALQFDPSVIGVEGQEDFNIPPLQGVFDSLRIIAYTDKSTSSKNDNVIVEAVEITDWLFPGHKIIAVQWHPEELKDFALLHNLFGIPQGVDVAIQGV